MDLLGHNHAEINYNQGTILFTPSQWNKVKIQGRSGKNPLKVVKDNKIAKGYRNGLPIYILKLKKSKKQEKNQDLEWLKEYQDVFLEELTNLHPKRELVHEIELIPGAQPIAKAPYKMSPSKDLELKNQLSQLQEQGFIKPSLSPWGAPILFQKKKDGTFCLCIDFKGLN